MENTERNYGGQKVNGDEFEEGEIRRTGTLNDRFDLQEAEDMDLETIRDPIMRRAADGAIEEGGDEENNYGGADRNKFVALVRHAVKADHFERYRHASSWTVQSFYGKTGFIASYVLQRWLPRRATQDDVALKMGDHVEAVGCSASFGQNDHGCSRKQRAHRYYNLCTRPLEKSDSTNGIVDEVGCHEIMTLHKFENTSAFHNHLTYESVLRWLTYSIAVKDMPSLPQVFLYQKQNGIHQEIATGQLVGQRQITINRNESSKEAQQEEERSLFVMIRQRTVSSTSNVNLDVLLNIMNRLSCITLEAEAGKCLAYDIHTSRDIDPNEQNVKIMELAIWETMEDYFETHLSMPYVKQSAAINAAFQQPGKDENTTTFWELLAPHGILESTPNVSFMNNIDAFPSLPNHIPK